MPVMSGDPCHANPSGTGAQPRPKPGSPLGKSCGCQTGMIWETKPGGAMRSPGPILPLWGTAGVSDVGSSVGLSSVRQDLASVGQEKPRPGNKLERMMPLKIWRGGLSPFSGLDSCGVRQRPPTPWAVVGALAVGLLACLFMLFSIQASLESLKEELAMLRREALCRAPGTDGQRDASDLRQRDVGGPVAHVRRTRWTRDVAKNPQQEPLMRPRKKHSVLHLVPVRHSNNEEGDATEIWWTPFLQQGGALEASGQEVVVRKTGLYFVYSQVLFHDPTFTMGQVLRRVALGRSDQILFRCIQSMPPKVEKAYNSCYSGGVFHLQQGDRLSLSIPRFNASFDISTHGTFLGVLRL
ncbi:tumor necrosis factor ligand superfamily member 13-like isoform X1 [Notechis scutatus]|uniref:Tumor necrosis factor ligand superfamily member 13-like isoform X1 n=1 Tax=Notechis scutatus TaxID=8663 RepID=A0A6J1VXB1_9SAUR|nr:tumor necrosis factor ligand superfamily member 13-like isoform X1 [Notechis scutatus]